jgi:hypothetical protein
MEIIEIQTLIDITNTRVIRPNQGTQLEIDQNRNFITMVQCAEMRSVVSYDSKPSVQEVDLKGLEFGTAYKGKHKIWTFRFVPDRVGVYVDDFGHDIGLLISDINGVPVVKNLTESVNIDKSIFELVDDKYRNTIIKALRNTV